MKKHILILTLCLLNCLLATTAFGQCTPVGTWEEHLMQNDGIGTAFTVQGNSQTTFRWEIDATKLKIEKGQNTTTFVVKPQENALGSTTVRAVGYDPNGIEVCDYTHLVEIVPECSGAPLANLKSITENQQELINYHIDPVANATSYNWKFSTDRLHLENGQGEPEASFSVLPNVFGYAEIRVEALNANNEVLCVKRSIFIIHPTNCFDMSIEIVQSSTNLLVTIDPTTIPANAEELLWFVGNEAVTTSITTTQQVFDISNVAPGTSCNVLVVAPITAPEGGAASDIEISDILCNAAGVKTVVIDPEVADLTITQLDCELLVVALDGIDFSNLGAQVIWNVGPIVMTTDVASGTQNSITINLQEERLLPGVEYPVEIRVFNEEGTEIFTKQSTVIIEDCCVNFEMRIEEECGTTLGMYVDTPDLPNGTTRLEWYIADLNTPVATTNLLGNPAPSYSYEYSLVNNTFGLQEGLTYDLQVKAFNSNDVEICAYTVSEQIDICQPLACDPMPLTITQNPCEAIQIQLNASDVPANTTQLVWTVNGIDIGTTNVTGGVSFYNFQYQLIDLGNPIQLTAGQTYAVGVRAIRNGAAPCVDATNYTIISCNCVSLPLIVTEEPCETIQMRVNSEDLPFATTAIRWRINAQTAWVTTNVTPNNRPEFYFYEYSMVNNTLNLLPGTTYPLQVQALSGSQTICSGIVFETVDACRNNFFRMSVYPNPTSNTLKVNVSGIEQVETADLKLYNKDGAVVKKISLRKSEATIDVSGLQKGVYYLRGKVGEKLVSEKVVIE